MEVSGRGWDEVRSSLSLSRRFTSSRRCGDRPGSVADLKPFDRRHTPGRRRIVHAGQARATRVVFRTRQMIAHGNRRRAEPERVDVVGAMAGTTARQGRGCARVHARRVAPWPAARPRRCASAARRVPCIDPATASGRRGCMAAAAVRRGSSSPTDASRRSAAGRRPARAAEEHRHDEILSAAHDAVALLFGDGVFICAISGS